jgi:hypothetical protein
MKCGDLLSKEGASCLSALAQQGHLFARAIGLNSRLMRIAHRHFCSGASTSIEGRLAPGGLISVVLLRAGSECVANLVTNCELLEAIAGVLPYCVKPEVYRLTEDVLGHLFDNVLAVAEDCSGAGLQLRDMLLASLRSSLKKPIAAFTEKQASGKSFDRIWSLYFDQGSPSYFKVVHRKRLVRYAIPNELVSATDITDRIGSFLSLSQLPTELHLRSEEEFPQCCLVTKASKACAESASRKRERRTEER